MNLNNREIILEIWDEIIAAAPEDREAKYEKLDAQQSDIVKFFHEELDGYDAVYSESVIPWLHFTFTVLMRMYEGKKKKVPKIKLDLLHEKIEAAESKVKPREIEEFCEADDNALLRFIFDLISHIDTKSIRKTSHMMEEDEEFNDIESYESNAFNEYDISEEDGDEDYMMFREMYEARDDHGDTDDDSGADEQARYTLFLVFKSIIDSAIEKLG